MKSSNSRCQYLSMCAVVPLMLAHPKYMRRGKADSTMQTHCLPSIFSFLSLDRLNNLCNPYRLHTHKIPLRQNGIKTKHIHIISENCWNISMAEKQYPA